MQLIAEGRMAEIFSLDGDKEKVVKLDRPEWNGVSAYESDVLKGLEALGLPVPASHGTVTIAGRCGVILDRVDGGSLDDLLVQALDTRRCDGLAARFATLQARINGASYAGLPDLVVRIGDEIKRSGLRADVVAGLRDDLVRLDDGLRRVCHFDFHPGNILVSTGGWIVIDWLTAASGPPAADFARTVLLLAGDRGGSSSDFARAVRRHGMVRMSLDDAGLAAWIRVIAGARLAEGFEGDYARWLAGVAEGSITVTHDA